MLSYAAAMTVMTAHESVVEIRGLRHRVLRWGPAAENSWILLHGFQDCADTFQFLVDELPEDWSCIALDWRGFGGSAQVGGPYWFPDYLADLDALLEILSPDRPVGLIGHSMGGNIAGLYAGLRPDRVTRLVSLEGFGLKRAAPEQAPDRYIEWMDAVREGPRHARYESPEVLAAGLQRRHPRLTAERARFIAQVWTRPLEAGGCTLAFDPWHRLVNPVLYRREEAEACWRRVKAPVLLLLGSESEYRRRLEADGDIDSFQRCFRDLRVHDLQGLGHLLHHEDPMRVAELIRDFAGESSPTGRQ